MFVVGETGDDEDDGVVNTDVVPFGDVCWTLIVNGGCKNEFGTVTVKNGWVELIIVEG